MKIIFSIFKYFPFGGAQRDFFRIASESVRRGHEVDIYTTDWEGDGIPGATITIMPVTGVTNHSRVVNFAKKVRAALNEGQYDASVGFDKIPGLDIYFAADVCLKTKLNRDKSFFKGLLSRYRYYLRLERSVFGVQSKTDILVLTPKQQAEYMDAYQTPVDRFCLLPPGINANRLSKEEMVAMRHDFRERLLKSFLSISSISDNKEPFLLLFVANKFQTKGLDRAIRALASLEDKTVRLIIVGGDRMTPFRRLAEELGVYDRLLWCGAQTDLPKFMLLADLLVHPSRLDSAGMVLLEALTFGLPVLTTDVCGYAFHIDRADAGELVFSPFEQNELNRLLKSSLNADKLSHWHTNALEYAHHSDLYSMAEKAVNFIESKGK